MGLDSTGVFVNQLTELLTSTRSNLWQLTCQGQQIILIEFSGDPAAWCPEAPASPRLT